MKSKMNETTFTRQFMKNWQRQRPDMLWYHKIADPTLGGNMTNDRAVDVVVCYDGAFVGMEWKLKKDKRAFPLKRVREGQVQTLCDIEVAGGLGLLMIGEYLGPHDKRVYIIPIALWNEKVALITEKKSIRLEDHFANCVVETYREASFTHWNTKPIEDYIERTKCGA